MRSWSQLEADAICDILIDDADTSDRNSNRNPAGVVDGERVVVLVEVGRPLVDIQHCYVHQRCIVLESRQQIN